MSESARILVIDDEESTRRTVSPLKRAGYVADTAENRQSTHGYPFQPT